MEYLYFKRGDTEPLNFTFVDNTDEDNPVPLSLVGATVFFTVKNIWDDRTDDNDALIKKDQTVHTDPANGETQIILSPSDTNIKIGEYKADIQIKEADSDIISSAEFRVIVEDDVTKRTT